MEGVSQELSTSSHTVEAQQVDLEVRESNQSTVCQFYLQGKCRFDEKCRNLHEGTPSVPQSTKSSRGVLGESREREDHKDHRFEKKKCPMRTAEDVINRIKWDEMLPEESFTVGYLDRFLGVQEEPFSTFSWEDLAAADYDVLAIPQHRIQYFKYKTEKVWEKSERLDLVFGSTGSALTIHQVMENVDRELEE